MTPAPARLQQEVVVELARQIGNFLQDRLYRVYVAPFDVQLPVGDEGPTTGSRPSSNPTSLSSATPRSSMS